MNYRADMVEAVEVQLNGVAGLQCTCVFPVWLTGIISMVHVKLS